MKLNSTIRNGMFENRRLFSTQHSNSLNPERGLQPAATCVARMPSEIAAQISASAPKPKRRERRAPSRRCAAALICCVVTLFAALVFTGCETEVIDHGAYLPLNVPVNEKENYVAVVLLNQRAQNSVAVPGIQEKHLPDGRLQVAVQLRNRESRRIQVQANCEFKDAQGFVLDSTPFQNVFLDENAQEQVNFISMTDKAAKYTIRVREAR
jgi:hypothetical protein